MNRPPSIDALLRTPEAAVLVGRFGRQAVTDALRETLAARRAARDFPDSTTQLLDEVADALACLFATSQLPVFNLTGTVLHTNLGRAPLPSEAAEAAALALRNATTLEFDLSTGKRGERESHIASLLCRLTGAPAATVVNNNAAAVLLVLNTFAAGREVVVSRGELIEIGGSFRLPEIMERAGARLMEVGTTNRTHERDFRRAISPNTALLLRVHPSNYAITGFTASVPPARLAVIAQEAGLVFAEDLGSGSLLDLARWGLPHEPTVRASLTAGAGVVTFSGDKLLGGPQAGLIAGHKEMIDRLNANPLKRALRLDKGTLAALEHVLRLYLDPDRLAESLPALRLLTRSEAAIQTTAEHVAPAMAAAFPGRKVAVEPCRSQIGSGALPVDRLPSVAVTLAGGEMSSLAASLRALPRPVIGRVAQGRLWLDCRCLEREEEPEFLAQLPTPG